MSSGHPIPSRAANDGWMKWTCPKCGSSLKTRMVEKLGGYIIAHAEFHDDKTIKTAPIEGLR